MASNLDIGSGGGGGYGTSGRQGGSSDGDRRGPFYALGTYEAPNASYLSLVLGDEVEFLPAEKQQNCPPGFFMGSTKEGGIGYVAWMFTTPVKIMEPLADEEGQDLIMNAMLGQLGLLVKEGIDSEGQDDGNGVTLARLDDLLQYVAGAHIDWLVENDKNLLELQQNFQADALIQSGDSRVVVLPFGAYDEARFPDAKQFCGYAVHVRPGPEILNKILTEIAYETGQEAPVALWNDAPDESPWAARLLEYFQTFSYRDLFGYTVEEDNEEEDQPPDFFGAEGGAQSEMSPRSVAKEPRASQETSGGLTESGPVLVEDSVLGQDMVDSMVVEHGEDDAEGEGPREEGADAVKHVVLRDGMLERKREV